MDANSIKDLIENGIEQSQAEVHLQGNSCQLVVVADAFEGLRTLKKQQLVYACLDSLIKSGELHAVSMQTFTRVQWQEQQKLGGISR